LKQSKPDTVPGYLYEKFTPDTQKLVTSFSNKKGEAAKLQSALCDELNRIIQAGSIYQADRFAAVKLTDETKKLVEGKQAGMVPMRLNRVLLEEAFEESMPKFVKVHSPQPAVIDQCVTNPTWRGIPVLVVVLLGGFAVNFIYCVILNIKNKTGGDYVKSGAPIVANLFFAGLAGALWTSQFICFKTGEPPMGAFSYVGWAVLMASMILFSTLLGIFLGEWNNTSGRTKKLLSLGLVFLVLSSVVSGISGYLK
jgi:hypothetical protein